MQSEWSPDTESCRATVRLMNGVFSKPVCLLSVALSVGLQCAVYRLTPRLAPVDGCTAPAERHAPLIWPISYYTRDWGYGGTRHINTSLRLQTWSVNPAAITGVRCCQRLTAPAPWSTAGRGMRKLACGCAAMPESTAEETEEHEDNTRERRENQVGSHDQLFH
jgi:hypothetical protein